MTTQARFILAATDSSAGAFRSFERNLGSLRRGVSQIRSLAASFGVALSGRALAQLMSRAIETTNAVGEQRVAVMQAQAAFREFSEASDQLAESFAVRATPAVREFFNALNEIRKFVMPTAGEIIESRIEQAQRELESLQTSINAPFRDRYLSAERRAEQDERARQLRENIQVLEAAQRAGETARALRERPLIPITPAEIKALEDFIDVLNLPKNIASQDEWVALESAIHELNQRPPLITPEERIALEEFIAELNMVKPTLTQEEWIDLESFIYDLNNMKSESEKTAEFIGDTFRDAFTDWILGTERDFAELLRRMAVQMAVSGIFEALAGTFSGGTSGVAKFFSSFFGGSRQSGGPVSAGKVYRVHPGEAFFSPGADGHVGKSGGMTINVGDTHIDARGADSSLVTRLPAILAQHRQQTKAEIAELIRRGRFAT